MLCWEVTTCGMMLKMQNKILSKILETSLTITLDHQLLNNQVLPNNLSNLTSTPTIKARKINIKNRNQPISLLKLTFLIYLEKILLKQNSNLFKRANRITCKVQTSLVLILQGRLRMIKNLRSQILILISVAKNRNKITILTIRLNSISKKFQHQHLIFQNLIINKQKQIIKLRRMSTRYLN